MLEPWGGGEVGLNTQQTGPQVTHIPSSMRLIKWGRDGDETPPYSTFTLFINSAVFYPSGKSGRFAARPSLHVGHLTCQLFSPLLSYVRYHLLQKLYTLKKSNIFITAYKGTVKNEKLMYK